jgi:hypothetical protein
MPDSRLSFLHIRTSTSWRRRVAGSTGRTRAPSSDRPSPHECPAADFIIASGDLISDESEDSYRRLQALLEPWRPHPLYDGEPR